MDRVSPKQSYVEGVGRTIFAIACIFQIEAANESTRIAETRLAEAREEVSRMQQRLLASEEAASRDTRKMDTLARDVKAEQQHAAATLERLERAHLRVQHLESQVHHSSPRHDFCVFLPSYTTIVCFPEVDTVSYPHSECTHEGMDLSWKVSE